MRTYIYLVKCSIKFVEVLPSGLLYPFIQDFVNLRRLESRTTLSNLKIFQVCVKSWSFQQHFTQCNQLSCCGEMLLFVIESDRSKIISSLKLNIVFGSSHISSVSIQWHPDVESKINLDRSLTWTLSHKEDIYSSIFTGRFSCN